MRTRRLILAGVVVAALALVPVVAFAGDQGGGRGDRLVLGFNLHSTGSTSTAGTFVVSGGLRDSGSSTVEDLAVVPLERGDRGKLTGVQRFVGTKGTILTRFEGVARDISDTHQWATGRFRIVDATGRYAGLRGGGRFTVVVDLGTDQFIGTEDGHTDR
jgi:hypothetical protein